MMSNDPEINGLANFKGVRGFVWKIHDYNWFCIISQRWQFGRFAPKSKSKNNQNLINFITAFEGLFILMQKNKSNLSRQVV